MRIILNVGLGDNDIRARERAIEVLRFAGSRCVRDREYKLRIAWDGAGHEWVAVLTAEWDNQYSLQCLDFLCRQIKQDCVAVFKEDLGYGVLIGPQHEKYGPFNPILFIKE